MKKISLWLMSAIMILNLSLGYIVYADEVYDDIAITENAGNTGNTENTENTNTGNANKSDNANAQNDTENPVAVPNNQFIEGQPVEPAPVVDVPIDTTKVVFLGEGKSNYSSSPSGRKFNIKKAAEKLNGKVVMPGEIFDFNKVVGPTSLSAGFKDAKVILDGEFVNGVGGGVCQVSSTLFNAVLNSGMDVLKRRNHSLRISYLPVGYDAAVSYGSLNLQFQNTYTVPVKIKASADGKKLVIKIVSLGDTYARVVSTSRTALGNNRFVVNRKIKEKNIIIKEDRFYSSYGKPKPKIVAKAPENKEQPKPATSGSIASNTSPALPTVAVTPDKNISIFDKIKRNMGN